MMVNKGFIKPVERGQRGWKSEEEMRGILCFVSLPNCGPGRQELMRFDVFVAMQYVWTLRIHVYQCGKSAVALVVRYFPN